MKELKEIFNAARVHRTLLPLAALLIPCAYANTMTIDIIYLGLCCVLAYTAHGIQNAIRDNDYDLPSYSKLFVIALILGSLFFALQNLVIIITVISWALLGFIYNNISRYYLMADTTIMAITHFTMPVISGSFILNLPLQKTIVLSSLIFIVFWLIMPSKNLVESEEDKSRGYSTLPTKLNNGRILTKLLWELSFIAMFAVYFVLDLSNLFLLIVLMLFLLRIVIFLNLDNNNEKHAVDLMRIVIMLYMFGLIIDLTNNMTVIFSGLFILLVYLPYMANSYRQILRQIYI